MGIDNFSPLLRFQISLRRKKGVAEYNPKEGIKDKKIFYRSAFVLVILIILFLTLDQLGVGAEAVALGCGVLALLICKVDPAEIFREIDWETVFFIA